MTPPLLIHRIERLADEAEIDLEWAGACWVAEDQHTGERVRGATIAEAWHRLRPHTSVEHVHEWLMNNV